jgi:cytochrome c556
MIRPVIITVAVALGVTAVVAQSDPIAERRNIMKGNGGAARTASQMIKGDVPFDLAKAQEIFAGFQVAAAKMPALYPDNSKTGGDTTANEKVWTDTAGFKAAFDKFSADAKAAGASTKDLDSFKAAFGSVAQNCNSCHTTFRKPT